jgi:segregation and condensation protein B
MPQSNLKSVIEALLFVSELPLNIEQIRGALDNLDAAQIHNAIEELSAEYEKSNRGMRITEVAGGFRMVTASGFSVFLKRLYKERFTERISKPALETLAIIAYKQPITKAEVQSLRNVNIDGVVSSLLEKNLIRVVGRKKSAGSPFVFGTTRQFLERFGLKSLDDLPKMEDFSKQITEGMNESEIKQSA